MELSECCDAPPTGAIVDKALELVENGMVLEKDMLLMCLKYMSTDDVLDMLDCNELSDRFLEEEEDKQYKGEKKNV